MSVSLPFIVPVRIHSGSYIPDPDFKLIRLHSAAARRSYILTAGSKVGSCRVAVRSLLYAYYTCTTENFSLDGERFNRFSYD